MDEPKYILSCPVKEARKKNQVHSESLYSYKTLEQDAYSLEGKL